MNELELRLDPKTPSKHCPWCKRRGVKSKVKYYKINLDSEAVVMCENIECPWPLTTHGPDEVILQVQTKTKEKNGGLHELPLADVQNPNVDDR